MMRAWLRETIASSERIAASIARPIMHGPAPSSTEPSRPCASRQRTFATYHG
jgi:hypothetical protein